MGIWMNLRQFSQQDLKHRIDEYLATTGIKPSRISRELPVQQQKKQRLGPPWWKLWWYLKQLVSNTCFPDINRGLWMQLVPCWIFFLHRCMASRNQCQEWGRQRGEQTILTAAAPSLNKLQPLSRCLWKFHWPGDVTDPDQRHSSKDSRVMR